MRKPDFENLLKVLHCEKPNRATLFEFSIHGDVLMKLSGMHVEQDDAPIEHDRIRIHGYTAGGYDYTILSGSAFSISAEKQKEKEAKGKKVKREKKETVSLNEGSDITDRKSYEEYPWADPDSFDYSKLDTLAEDLPKGMKFITRGPGGVLENVIGLVGFDNLCFMVIDDPELAEDLFREVGTRLARYYEICAGYDSVGACVSHDDWGFKTQTMFSPELMRRFVVPWHKLIAEKIHAAGKPAILHCCGQVEALMDDIIDYIGYEGKHSYEDTILPVEDAYEKWGGRIAILGGIDVDFICRSTPERIKERSERMIERTFERGGYALGTGNGVTRYVPHENYFAMTSAVLGQ